MDPFAADVSSVSEAPSHENDGDLGGGTLKTGSLENVNGIKISPSESTAGRLGDGIEYGEQAMSENSVYLSTISGPKGDIFPDGDAVDMSTRGNTVTSPSNLDLAGKADAPRVIADFPAGSSQEPVTEHREGDYSQTSYSNLSESPNVQNIPHETKDGILSFDMPEDDVHSEDQIDRPIETSTTKAILPQTYSDQTEPASNSLPAEIDTSETYENVYDPENNIDGEPPSDVQENDDQDYYQQEETDITTQGENIEGYHTDSQESAATEINSEMPTIVPEEEVEEDIVFDFSVDVEDEVCEVSPSGKLNEETVLYMNDQQCIQVMKNMHEQRLQGEFCDITIKVQDTNFKAHKCVLASNGAVLHSMVKDDKLDVIDLSESVNNSVAFESILEYLYTGQLSISMAIVSDIMALCRTLGISELAQCCFLHIEKNINMDNWAHILDLSLNYDFPETTQKVMKFFSDHLRHLYKMKEAMYFSPEHLEQILKKGNQRHLPEIELHKLDLALRWVVNDYNGRCSMLPSLLQYIRLGLITKEGLEGVFRQKIIRVHQILQDQNIQMFLSDVRECLITRRKALKLARKPRKAVRPIKISKRGRPRKMVDYSMSNDLYVATDDSSIELPDEDVDYVPGLPVEPVVVLKKRRGRPPKRRDAYTNLTKRPRGRPRTKASVEPPMQKLLNFSEVQVKQELTEGDLAAADGATVVMPEDADVKPQAGVLSKMIAMKTMASKGTYQQNLLYKRKAI